MILSQLKEREHRFKLALKMGLPIFVLFLVLIFQVVFNAHNELGAYFFIELVAIFALSIYIIFYLIYKGFDKKLTDSISKAFTKEYFYTFLSSELKKHKNFTLVLVSIENLNEINFKYGVNNSDKIVQKTIVWIDEFLKSKDIHNTPIGHIRGSHFLLYLQGEKILYKPIFEFMSLKAQDITIDDVEIKINTTINDTTFSQKLDYLIENLFEQLREQKESQKFIADVDPSEYEYSVINALKRRDLTIYGQDVLRGDGSVAFKECSIKLKDEDGKILHQKEYLKVLNKLRMLPEYDLMALEKIISLTKNSSHTYAMHITGSTLRNHHSLVKIKDLFNNAKIEKNRIIFIFSESEYYSYTERFNTILDQLRDLGIMIVVDRLGALHSSFLYLKDLHIDVIRFATNYSKESAYKSSEFIFDGFALMAKKRGIKTWVKLIESKEAHEHFVSKGVDYLQGKYLSSLEELI